MKLADEIIILENGQVKKRGAQEELFSAILSELANECDFGREGGNNSNG
jgi:ABC-type molybdate transport system ATPase subunit